MTLRSFRFRAGDSTTEVAVGAGALERLGARLPRIAKGRWLVVSSEPVFSRHGARLLAAAPRLEPAPLLVPDGEAAKSWSRLGRLLDELVARGLKRDGGVVALGGGTVGDVAGLAASLVLRGVPIVQVPTTLLAASDSALGGKTAVNLEEGKNLAGTVHQPSLVAVEPLLLATLPERDYRSGLAEVVKSSFLDATFSRAMGRLSPGLEARAEAAVTEGVFRSLRLKARVVASDPLETEGHRFALNLGHTVGHALETASRHRLAHGEAVAWGLLAILELSVARAGLTRRAADGLAAQVASLCRPPRLAGAVLASWPARLGADKKSDSRGLRAVLLRRPGTTVVERVDARELMEALDRALDRYN